MKLFISYSRDDKAWVETLYSGLEEGHDPFIDRRITAAADWWRTILDEIEQCDCFIYVMTPESVKSPFCVAELKYAVALNKPIAPIMLKDCTFPKILDKKQIQYIPAKDLSLDKILIRLLNGLIAIKDRMADGSYAPQKAKRPPTPKVNKKEQGAEALKVAIDAIERQNFDIAVRVLQEILRIDPKGLGIKAEELLSQVETSNSSAQRRGRPERGAAPSVRFDATSQAKAGSFNVPQGALDELGIPVNSTCHFTIIDRSSGAILLDKNLRIGSARQITTADGVPPQANIRVFMTLVPPGQ